MDKTNINALIQSNECSLEYFLTQFFPRKSNSNGPRANVFPSGEAQFGQAMYRSLERSSQDTARDGFYLYTAQASFAWLRVDLVVHLAPLS